MVIDIFEGLNQEIELYHKIKIKANKDSNYDKTKSTLLFNYYLYSALMDFSVGLNSKKRVQDCLRQFIIKEPSLNNQIMIINNTYQIATMLDFEPLMKQILGQNSSFLIVDSDAAKLGALLALNYKKSGVGKLATLTETLFLT